MSVKSSTKQEMKTIEGLIKTLNADIFALFNQHSGNEELKKHVSALYNFKDLLEGLSDVQYIQTNYYMPSIGTYKAIYSILEKLSASTETKENFELCIETICSINNKKYRESTPEEKDKDKNIYISHLKDYVIKGEKFAYRNKFKPSKLLNKNNRKRKLLDDSVVTEQINLSQEKIKHISDEYVYLTDGNFTSVYTTAAHEYFSVFIPDLVDIKVYPDGRVVDKSKSTVSSKPAEPTPVIEQKPAPVAKAEPKPSAPAKPKPAPEPDPEPEYEEVDEVGIEADDVEQDLINGVENEDEQ